MSARDDLAKVFAEHQYALGYDGILSDGQWAWLKCTCGYKENVELPTDDIRIAEAAWERHLADAILTAGWVSADTMQRICDEAVGRAISDAVRDGWREDIVRGMFLARDATHAALPTRRNV